MVLISKIITADNSESFLNEEVGECYHSIKGAAEEALQKLKYRLQDFKQKNTNSRVIECLLPEELGNLIKESQITMRILQTNEQWHGLTHPQDEEQVRRELIIKKSMHHHTLKPQ